MQWAQAVLFIRTDFYCVKEIFATSDYPMMCKHRQRQKCIIYRNVLDNSLS